MERAILNQKCPIDDAGKTELTTYESKLTEYDGKRQVLRQATTSANAALNLASDDLRRTIIQTRKALDGYAISGRMNSKSPRATTGMYLASRIHAVAVSHMQALESVTGDAAVDAAKVSLKAAMDGFGAAENGAKAQRQAWKGFNETMNKDIQTIAGKLVGYKFFASYNMPPTERRNLRNEIKAVIAARKHARKAAVATPVVPVPQPSPVVVAPTVPALPAFPATVVPPSSEHPAISATA